MTTTAYDTHFIASDIAFTDADGNVSVNIPFGKVKRIGKAVFGMAGCIHCMVDFSNMILDCIKGDVNFEMPDSILNSEGMFIALVSMDGACFKVSKINNDFSIDNVTNIPTVIGTGGSYVESMLDDCPNAVVAVLEAIKHDRHTSGDVKYCSIKREDIHNLEVHAMSAELKIQVAGIQQEINNTVDFLSKPEMQGKEFRASTEVFHKGTPSKISKEVGMMFLRQGFASIGEELRKS